MGLIDKQELIDAILLKAEHKNMMSIKEIYELIQQQEEKT